MSELKVAEERFASAGQDFIKTDKCYREISDEIGRLTENASSFSSKLPDSSRILELIKEQIRLLDRLVETQYSLRRTFTDHIEAIQKTK